MGKAIGIDLGTTNSVAAIKTKDLRVLQNKENEDLTPSVVCLYKGEKVIGSKAVDRMASAPTDTIFSIKRLMGRAFSDHEVQKVKEHVKYQIVAPSDGTEDDVRVLLGGKEYSPIEVSSMILKKLKEDAEMRLNDKVEFAVITVPAYFNEKQRDATRKAGRLAGLKVQRILSEPTAAAIAYGVDNIGPDDSKTVLVYDLGGGTFDVSVLTIVGGTFAELDVEGDMWLGGDDFDKKIMDRVLKKVKEEYGEDGDKNLRFMAELKKRAEKAKKDLSSMHKAEIVITGILQDSDKNLIDVEMELSRSEFEAMIADDVKRSVELVMIAIKNASLTPDQIQEVLLVGGSSCIPMVRQALVKAFGEEKILMNIDPMKCVAQGAGILAAKLDIVECPKCHAVNPGTLENCEKCSEPLGNIVLARVTGTHYGIETTGGKFDIIIEKGSPYPTPEPIVKTFHTPRPNMRRIKVPVRVGENEMASQTELQVTAWLQLPEKVDENTPVDVAFKLDEDGILDYIKVSLKDGSGREIEVYPERGGDKRGKLEKEVDVVKRQWDGEKGNVDSDRGRKIDDKFDDVVNALNRNDMEEAERKLKEIQGLIPKAPEEPSKDEWKIRAENIAGFAEVVLNKYGYLMDADQTYGMKKKIEELRDAVAKNNQQIGEQKFTDMVKELDALPGIVNLLMNALIAQIRADNTGDAVRADKVKTLVAEIEEAIKRNDVPTVQKKVIPLKILIKEILETDGEPPTPGDEELLRSFRRHPSSSGHI